MEKKKHILIVEDEAALLGVLAEKLTREGFLVSRARDGMEGLKEISRHMPDLILLDIIMPDLDGVSMLKQLRANKQTEHIPVIIISNLSEVEKITEILQAKKGVIEHIVKSHWSMSELVAKINQTLKVYEILEQA
jgi:DNA-binding response OmpR family regulator